MWSDCVKWVYQASGYREWGHFSGWLNVWGNQVASSRCEVYELWWCALGFGLAVLKWECLLEVLLACDAIFKLCSFLPCKSHIIWVDNPMMHWGRLDLQLFSFFPKLRSTFQMQQKKATSLFLLCFPPISSSFCFSSSNFTSENSPQGF